MNPHSIVSVSWLRGCPFASPTRDSCSERGQGPAQMILVDDALAHENLADPESASPPIRSVQNTRNAGFARAVNPRLPAARGAFVPKPRRAACRAAPATRWPLLGDGPRRPLTRVPPRAIQAVSHRAASLRGQYPRSVATALLGRSVPTGSTLPVSCPRPQPRPQGPEAQVPGSVLGVAVVAAPPAAHARRLHLRLQVRPAGPAENYAYFLLAGLLPWNFFAGSLTASTGASWATAT